MDKQRSNLEKWFFILGFFYVVISFIPIYLLDSETTEYLTREDSFYEWISAIGFFFTAVLFLLVFLHLYKTSTATPRLQKLAFLVLVPIFFFGAAEEISWGQRVLNFETPERIKAINEQNETTIHNLVLTQGDNELPIGFGDLFNMFWLTLTVLIPVTALASPRIEKFYKNFVPVFPWLFGLLFLFNWAVAKLGGVIYRTGVEVNYIPHDMVEVKESNYAVMFVVVALFTYLTVSQAHRRMPATENMSLSLDG